MRKYILLSLLLLTAGTVFFALHEYVEVSVLATVQAQTKGNADAEVNNTGIDGGEICDYGCKPHATPEDLNAKTNPDDLTREQIVANALGKKLEKGQKRKGDR